MNLKNMDIEIVEANEEEHKNLLGFLMREYPALGWSKEFIQWQYYNNPSGVAKSWVAKHNGNVIANYTAIPHQLNLFNNIENSWRVQDVITHPDYRGLGLYSRLSDRANEFLQSELFPLNFTFPNENSHNGFIKKNWKCPHRIPLWICDDPRNLKQISFSSDIETIMEFGVQDEVVWRNYCQTPKIAIDRSVDYLNWRYFQNPRKGYFAFRLTNEAKSAVSIIKLFQHGSGDRYAHLIDYFYDHGFPVKDIVNHFIQFGIEKNIQISSTWSQPNAELSSYLSNCGYSLQTGLTRWLVLNMNDKEFDFNKVSDFSNWHISMGDTDVF